MDRNLINQQVDEILDAEGFEDEFECRCDELPDELFERDPATMTHDEIPQCDACKKWDADLRAEIEEYRKNSAA